MIRKANENGWIEGLCAYIYRDNAMEFTHPPYANDTLFFCEAEVIYVMFKGYPNHFEDIFGVQVN